MEISFNSNAKFFLTQQMEFAQTYIDFFPVQGKSKIVKFSTKYGGCITGGDSQQRPSECHLSNAIQSVKD